MIWYRPSTWTREGREILVVLLGLTVLGEVVSFVFAVIYRDWWALLAPWILLVVLGIVLAVVVAFKHRPTPRPFVRVRQWIAGDER